MVRCRNCSAIIINENLSLEYYADLKAHEEFFDEGEINRFLRREKSRSWGYINEYRIKVINYCESCFPIFQDKWIKSNEKGVSLRRITYEKLEIKVKELEKELEFEREANLEMLENLKFLNEKKYNERLEIALKEKTQRIEFLERLLFENSAQRKLELLEEKFAQLESKYSELMINES